MLHPDVAHAELGREPVEHNYGLLFQAIESVTEDLGLLSPGVGVLLKQKSGRRRGREP